MLGTGGCAAVRPADGPESEPIAKGVGRVQSLALENWAVEWARQAREVPGGQIAAGLLVDLVADPHQHLARSATFPLGAAAAALRTEPAALQTALRSLADAGLLVLACHDTTGPEGRVAVVTLTAPATTAGHRTRTGTTHEPPTAPAPDSAPSTAGLPDPAGRGSAGRGSAGPGSTGRLHTADQEAVDRLAGRLTAAHPLVAPATVAALVATAYQELRAARIRTFVPVLVERRVRALLRAAARPDAPPVPEG